MSIFGTPGPIPSSRPVGPESAASARKLARRVKASTASDSGTSDEDSVEIHSPEEIDGARNLAKTGDEEAQQDHRQRGDGYPEKPGEPSLDLQG